MTSTDAKAGTYNVAAGKTTYDASCVTCHKTGLMGAPKMGDKANWAPRIAQGLPVLISHADKGFKGKQGMMPAKGGNATISTTEVGNAVSYIVKQSK